MKYNNKLNAFTLAEVMILLLTLSILMAAFAPVFTRRYNNASSDDVWAFVASDDNENAYFDVVNKSYTSQAFIGLTPTGDYDVKRMSSDGSDNVLYSKLVIAAGDSVKPGNKKQNQILFRYGTNDNDKAGDPVGALFADGTNFLLGGLYNNTVTGSKNTAYGSGALQALTSGSYNTAVGKDALLKLTSGQYNTAVGVSAGSSILTANYNTAVGVNALKNITGSGNTAIGNDAMGNGSGSANYNTAVGNMALYNITTGSYNVAVGYGAMKNLTSGAYNVAIGYHAMDNLTSGSYNTAVGAFSCGSSDLTTGKYKTCIGYNSGNEGMSKLYTTDDERVFIGSAPAQYVNSTGADKPAAVLEVHNINNTLVENTRWVSDTAKRTMPIPFVGDSSVVINGNLIVRGNPYFETPIYRPSNQKASSIAYGTSNYDHYYEAHIPKGLVLYKLSSYDGKWVFHGFDGNRRTEASWETCRGGCGRGSHAFYDVRPNCICTAVNDQTFELTENSGLDGQDGRPGSSYNIGRQMTNFDTTYDHYEKYKVIKVSSSYDWASKTFALKGAYVDARSPYNGTAKIFPSKFGGDPESCNNFYDDSTPDDHSQKYTSNSPIDGNRAWEQPYINNGAYYKDRSFDKYIYLERRPTRCRGGFDNDSNCRGYEYGMKGTDKPYAHMRLQNEVGQLNVQKSCCPLLTDEISNYSSPYKDLHGMPEESFQLSDRRLKDIGERFTAGLNEIRKLNIYNYTFKTDKNNIPQVGVIAQDLRLVFPNSVSKDANGYYNIRWDEMFYAAINSIKSLYTKAQELVVQVSNDRQRVSDLKADNKELNLKLDNLEKQLDKLEADKR